MIIFATLIDCDTPTLSMIVKKIMTFDNIEKLEYLENALTF